MKKFMLNLILKCTSEPHYFCQFTKVLPCLWGFKVKHVFKIETTSTTTEWKSANGSITPLEVPKPKLKPAADYSTTIHTITSQLVGP